MGKAKKERVLTRDAVMARCGVLRVSPGKLSQVAALIRGLDVSRALDTLAFSRRRIAADVRKVLLSAVANAENNNQLDVDRLYVDRIEVGKAMTMKRWRARARGRSASISKYFSRVSIVVREREEQGDGSES